MIHLRGAGPAASRGVTNDMDSQSKRTPQLRVHVDDGVEVFIVSTQALMIAH